MAECTIPSSLTHAGLKSHAVTLYEAGKLGDSCIVDLCNVLASLEGKRFEGVLQEFANHAFSLRYFLECLLSGGTSPNETSDNTSEANNQECSLQDDLYTHSTKKIIEDGDNVVENNESSHQITESSDGGHQDVLSQQDHQMGDSDAADGIASSLSTIVSESKESILKHDFANIQTTQLGGSTGNSPSWKTKRNYRVNIAEVYRREIFGEATHSTRPGALDI